MKQNYGDKVGIAMERKKGDHRHTDEKEEEWRAQGCGRQTFRYRTSTRAKNEGTMFGIEVIDHARLLGVRVDTIDFDNRRALGKIRSDDDLIE